MSTMSEPIEIPVLEEEPAVKPRALVVGDTFIHQSEEGEIRIRLRFKTKLLRSIRDLPDEIDQVFALLDGIGDKKTAEQLDELDIFETVEVVSNFFRAFEQKQQARLGESSRSSN